MATTKTATAPMKVAQIPKTGSRFRDRRARDSGAAAQDRCASRCRPAAFATVTCSRKKARGPEFSIRAFQDTKSRASSMKWAPVFPRGRRDSASASAGMAARTTRVCQCRRGDFRNCRN